MKRKRYAIVGTGSRGLEMYAKPIMRDYSDYVELVGLYDINPLRAEAFKREADAECMIFDSFDEMVQISKPDYVIITTVDRMHEHYVIRTLELGCDAIVEKPLCIDSDMCNRILEAEKRTGHKVEVTFNARCGPAAGRVKRIIQSGEIGEVYNIHFEWMLDQAHGADYFRRWHSELSNSGSLLIHKASHHFDMVNWFIDDEPKTVSAFGTTRFYGSGSDMPYRGERCSKCKHAKNCPLYVDLKKIELYDKLYFQCESADNYMRDRCLFSERVSIYDSMTLNVRYNRGAIMSYNLHAFSPYEGHKLVLNGSKGRLEYEQFRNLTYDNFDVTGHSEIRLYRHDLEVNVIKPSPGSGGSHGGADDVLRDVLFIDPELYDLPYSAGSRSGIMSAIIGSAANISIRENRMVEIDEILRTELL